MIEDLRNLEFHDGVLLELNISFDSNEVMFSFEQGIEADDVKITFKNVSEFSIEAILKFQRIECIDIYDVEFKKTENGIFSKFVFILEEGPSVEMSFLFSSYELQFSPEKCQ